MSRSVGQIKSGSTDKATNSSNADATAEALERAESKRLLELKGEIEGLIDASDLMKQFKNQIMLDITPEGLRIQIVDERNRPMFDSGSAVLKDYMKDILRNLTKLLNQVPNKLTLSGHTDATPYAAGNKGYSNWELSADRANTTRRVMQAHGVRLDQVAQVRGFADQRLRNVKDAEDPSNRRISIIVQHLEGKPKKPAAAKAPAADAHAVEQKQEAHAEEKPAAGGH